LFAGVANVPVSVNLFLRAGHAIAIPTNQFSENEKFKGIENIKVKKKNILAKQPPPQSLYYRGTLFF